MGMNERAWELLEELEARKEELNVSVRRMKSGVKIIDAGIQTKGSVDAGILISEICMGGLGKVSIGERVHDGGTMPVIQVHTDEPTISTLGSQFAGWRIRTEGYGALGSGPARTLSLQPRELYEYLGYKEESEVGVLFMETRKYPPLDLTVKLARKCNVDGHKFAIIIAPTASIVGSVQIAARIVETGIHKMHQLRFDTKRIKHALGSAPLPPIDRDDIHALGRTNDSILYGGDAVYFLASDTGQYFGDQITKIPSSSSPMYGKPFYEIFKAASFDFYKIDDKLFSPARVTLNDLRTGESFTAGKIDWDILKESFNLKEL